MKWSRSFDRDQSRGSFFFHAVLSLSEFDSFPFHHRNLFPKRGKIIGENFFLFVKYSFDIGNLFGEGEKKKVWGIYLANEDHANIFFLFDIVMFDIAVYNHFFNNQLFFPLLWIRRIDLSWKFFRWRLSNTNLLPMLFFLVKIRVSRKVWFSKFCCKEGGKVNFENQVLPRILIK